jgi:hypothetical protein
LPPHSVPACGVEEAVLVGAVNWPWQPASRAVAGHAIRHKLEG